MIRLRTAFEQNGTIRGGVIDDPTYFTGPFFQRAILYRLVPGVKMSDRHQIWGEINISLAFTTHISDFREACVALFRNQP